MSEEDRKQQEGTNGVSRRDFMKLSGLAVATPMVVGPTVLEVEGQQVAVYGPGKMPVTLQVNGKRMTAELEPRVTLLDALRDQFNLTGAKRVCDRGTCGACTVLMDGKPVYSCSVLAVDAQGHAITTIEGLDKGEQLTALQQAFVDNDAQQCGFCTPGFVVATTAFLEKHSKPTAEDVRLGLSGNLCRCGTYRGIHQAIAQVSGQKGSVNRG
jgi:xanthine dehydrogenase YagT iron-sulfur-binding subunit